MATYDLHQHLWPEAFVAAMRARTTPPFLAQKELVTNDRGGRVNPFLKLVGSQNFQGIGVDQDHGRAVATDEVDLPCRGYG